MLEHAFKQLEKMKDFVLFHDVDLDINFEVIEKSLEALEIIKKYANKDGVHIDFKQTMKINQNATWDYDEEVIKEYDLLKGVLTNGSED